MAWNHRNKMFQEDETQLRTKVVLQKLLDYSTDESFFNTDSAKLENESLLEASINLGYVSDYRGSERSTGSPKSLDSTLRLFNDSALDTKKVVADFENLEDSFFLDADTGKEMMLKDQEEMENELTIKTAELSCTGCSSWVPISHKKLSNLLMTLDNEDLKDHLCISVGEYIATRTECLGSLSEKPVQSKQYFGCDASTPVGNSQNVALIDDDNNKDSDCSFSFSTPRKNKRFSSCSTLSPDFLCSVKPKTFFVTPKCENTDDFNYYIGATCYKNIKRLRAEERILNKSRLQLLDDSDTLENMNSFFGDDFGTSHSKDSLVEQWVVQPQEISLDVTKGNRVQIINNSKQDMKFKIKFDGHIINAGPIQGTIHAKKQIGLRILVSRARKVDDVETDVKIISGNREKTVRVKILKDQKPKTLVKKRSFLLH